MPLAMVGLGTKLANVGVDQRVSAKIATPMLARSRAEARLVPVLFRRTGVNRRTSVLLRHNGDDTPAQSFYAPKADDGDLGPTTSQRMDRYHREAPALAQAAATQALEEARLQPHAITDIVTVSCTGFAAPGLDIALIKRLGMAASVSRAHIGFMGCHGAFNALRIASALAAQNHDARVLVCATELCSLHFGYGWNPQQIVANALFADGAGAVVGRAAGERDAWQVVAHGSTLLPDCEDAMTWHIGDHGFEMTLSPRVPALIQTHLRPWLTQWLAREGLAVRDVPSWAVHPGGPRIVWAVADALGLSHDALDDSCQVLSECGNMSSPTILFILDRLRRRDAPRPCVALGFGPGLAIEAMLLR